jgi:hypothetical protein
MANSDNLFDDDDEETQRDLLNHAFDDQTLQGRLVSLSKRFAQDHQNPSVDDQWQHLVETVKRAGFNANVSLKNPAPSVESSASRPLAFDSDEGKKHLKATKSILGLSSEQRAVQLTMCAVRDLKDSKNLQSLLGSRRLLETVMKYHYRQRIARISTVAELLRQEQDGSGADEDSIGQVLGSLDSTCTIDGQERGLFKILLSIACRKVDGQVLTREQLSSSKELSEGTPPSLAESLNKPSAENSWYQFAAQCLNESRMCFHEERIQAMEALVALLYARTAVRRVEYMFLLTAFQSTDAFFTVNTDDEKLSQLAGLICAECMGLWRVFEESPSDVAWVHNHPLLEGVLPGMPGVSTSQAEKELDALKRFLQSCPDENIIIFRQHQMESRLRTAPESLAFLSYGLILILAYDAILPSNYGSDASAAWQVISCIVCAEVSIV